MLRWERWGLFSTVRSLRPPSPPSPPPPPPPPTPPHLLSLSLAAAVVLLLAGGLLAEPVPNPVPGDGSGGGVGGGLGVAPEASLVGMADNSRPIILEEPKDAYVIKNKPAVLTCRAANALRVYFKCNGASTSEGDETENSFVEPMSGVRVVEVQLQVQKKHLDEGRSLDGYSCHCVAWSSWGETPSKSAQVSTAFLRGYFEEPPYSQSVPLEQQVELRCIPPEGRPQPQTKWLKDGSLVDITKDPIFRISSEGSLLIQSARTEDSANYTCVAENVAGTRTSDPAVLKVYVNGAWTSWSSWSTCSKRCGRGVQRRTRTCTAPTPQNGGDACLGEAVQKADCSQMCPAVDGSWSSWSSWSTCSPDCRHHRQRSCSSPPPQHGGRYCAGDDMTSSNCTGGMCRSGSTVRMYGDRTITEEATAAVMQQDVTLIVVLAVLVPLVLLLLVVVFRKFNRKDRHDGPMYEIATSDYPMSFYCETTKKMNGLGPPDLTQEVPTAPPPLTSHPLCYNPAYSDPAYSDPVSVSSDQKSSIGLMDSMYQEHYSAPASGIGGGGGGGGGGRTGSVTSTSEHHYDVPHLRCHHVQDSPTHSEAAHLLPSRSLATPTLNGSLRSQCLDSSESSQDKPTRSNSPASLSSDASACRPSLSSYSEPNRGCQLPQDVLEADGMTWGVMTSAGGRLVMPEYGVVMTIPEGALPKDTCQQMYVAAKSHPQNAPYLTERQTLLSPVIMCGPANVLLLKPAVLSFEHCASLQHATWEVHVFATDTLAKNSEHAWFRLITIGEERNDTPVLTQLDGSQVHLMIETLQQFVLVGESAGSNAAVKQLKVVAAAPPPTASGALNVSISITHDTTAGLTSITQIERKRGASLLDKPKTLLLQDCGANLCLTLDDLGPGWLLPPSQQYQEVSFERLWNGSNEAVSVAFTLNRTEGKEAPLACRVVTQQKGLSTHRQLLRINSDFPYAPVTASPAHTAPRGLTVTSSSDSSSSVTLTPERASFRLPQRLRQELCHCLDPPNARGNDWRMLASRLNLDRYLNYFACKRSPTEHILDLFEARHRDPNALTDLLNILRVIGRPDAVHVLESHAGAWV